MLESAVGNDLHTLNSPYEQNKGSSQFQFRILLLVGPGWP